MIKAASNSESMRADHYTTAPHWNTLLHHAIHLPWWFTLLSSVWNMEQEDNEGLDRVGTVPAVIITRDLTLFFLSLTLSLSALDPPLILPVLYI